MSCRRTIAALVLAVALSALRPPAADCRSLSMEYDAGERAQEPPAAAAWFTPPPGVSIAAGVVLFLVLLVVGRNRRLLIFVCHSHRDAALADRLANRLRADGHRVFHDETSLAKGGAFDSEIRRRIQACDVFLFLLSPASVSPGSYALTELKVIQKRWPNPAGNRILPILASDTPMQAVPAYLAAVNILRPVGESIAEVGLEIDARSRQVLRRRAFMALGSATLLVTPLVALAIFHRGAPPASVTEIDESVPPPPPDATVDSGPHPDAASPLDRPRVPPPDARPRPPPRPTRPPPLAAAIPRRFEYSGHSAELSQLSQALPAKLADTLIARGCPVLLAEARSGGKLPAARYRVRGDLTEIGGRVRMSAQVVDAKTGLGVGGGSELAVTPIFLAAEKKLTEAVATALVKQGICVPAKP
jgi:hypothetical protein